jgi:hypothetical protein
MVSAAALLFSSSTSVWADNLDSNTIKQIHDQIKVVFMEKCKKDLTKFSDSTCHCIADKAAADLDDDALSKCPNDNTGDKCITLAVSTATKKAMSEDSIKTCLAQKDATTTTTSTTTENAAAPASTTTTTTTTGKTDENAAQSSVTIKAESATESKAADETNSVTIEPSQSSSNNETTDNASGTSNNVNQNEN